MCLPDQQEHTQNPTPKDTWSVCLPVCHIALPDLDPIGPTAAAKICTTASTVLHLMAYSVREG